MAASRSGRGLATQSGGDLGRVGRMLVVVFNVVVIDHMSCSDLRRLARLLLLAAQGGRKPVQSRILIPWVLVSAGWTTDSRRVG